MNACMSAVAWADLKRKLVGRGIYDEKLQETYHVTLETYAMAAITCLLYMKDSAAAIH